MSTDPTNGQVPDVNAGNEPGAQNLDPHKNNPGQEPEPNEEPKFYDEATVRKLRTENATWRTKYRDATEELDGLRRQVTLLQESETSLKGQVDKLTSAQSDIKLRAAFETEAAKLGAADTNLVFEKLAREAVEYDESGNPKPETLTKAIEAVRTDHPVLFTQRNDIGQNDKGGAPKADNFATWLTSALHNT